MELIKKIQKILSAADRYVLQGAARCSRPTVDNYRTDPKGAMQVKTVQMMLEAVGDGLMLESEHRAILEKLQDEIEHLKQYFDEAAYRRDMCEDDDRTV